MVSNKDWVGNAKSIFVCNGASNHTDEKRAEFDFYATEPKAIDKLYATGELTCKNIWECACGEGHLSKRLEELGFKVKSTDLIDRGYGQGEIDFFECNEVFNGDILTNPPYKKALEFVLKSLDLITEGHKVFMFLKLTFLEGKTRYKKIFPRNHRS